MGLFDGPRGLTYEMRLAMRLRTDLELRLLNPRRGPSGESVRCRRVCRLA